MTAPWLALAMLSTTACISTLPELLADPTVQLHTPGAGELGVSTDFGVVFLGQGARSGSVKFTTWFDDGPSMEKGIVEPIGGGLYMVRSELLLPVAHLTFAEPVPGDTVLVRGRSADGPYEIPALVVGDPRVDGILVQASSALRKLGADQTGAGVYLSGTDERVLVGLVSGRLRLEGDGEGDEVLTVVGPRDLWRLVTYHRNLERWHQAVQRADVL